jgi:hypothetical protein
LIAIDVSGLPRLIPFHSNTSTQQHPASPLLFPPSLVLLSLSLVALIDDTKVRLFLLLDEQVFPLFLRLFRDLQTIVARPTVPPSQAKGIFFGTKGGISIWRGYDVASFVRHILMDTRGLMSSAVLF